MLDRFLKKILKINVFCPVDVRFLLLYCHTAGFVHRKKHFYIEFGFSRASQPKIAG